MWKEHIEQYVDTLIRGVDCTGSIFPRVVTWSSRVSSQKQGMYLAHSTSISSCCFIDSHTSSAVATNF